VSPHAAVNVQVGPAKAPLALFARVARAFKAPTLDQLFDGRPFPDPRGGTFLISNPTLQPQRARTLEAGLGWWTERVRVEATAYATEVRNEIDFDPLTFRYGNIGRSRHRGVELGIRVLEHSRFSADAAYAFTAVESTDAPGRQLKNIPAHGLRAGASATLPAGVRVHVRLRATSRRFLDDANTVPVAGWWLLDGRVTRRFGPVDAGLDVTNAADSDVEEIGYVLPDGRGGVVPYALPGAPRAVRLTIRTHF
jgi:outer membrane receptor protein involved in Fe transport